MELIFRFQDIAGPFSFDYLPDFQVEIAGIHLGTTYIPISGNCTTVFFQFPGWDLVGIPLGLILIPGHSGTVLFCVVRVLKSGRKVTLGRHIIFFYLLTRVKITGGKSASLSFGGI